MAVMIISYFSYSAGGSPDFRINETSGVISNTVPLDARNGSRIYTLNVTAIGKFIVCILKVYGEHWSALTC